MLPQSRRKTSKMIPQPMTRTSRKRLSKDTNLQLTSFLIGMSERMIIYKTTSKLSRGSPRSLDLEPTQYHLTPVSAGVDSNHLWSKRQETWVN